MHLRLAILAASLAVVAAVPVSQLESDPFPGPAPLPPQALPPPDDNIPTTAQPYTVPFTEGALPAFPGETPATVQPSPLPLDGYTHSTTQAEADLLVYGQPPALALGETPETVTSPSSPAGEGQPPASPVPELPTPDAPQPEAATVNGTNPSSGKTVHDALRKKIGKATQLYAACIPQAQTAEAKNKCLIKATAPHGCLPFLPDVDAQTNNKPLQLPTLTVLQLSQQCPRVMRRRQRNFRKAMIRRGSHGRVGWS